MQLDVRTVFENALQILQIEGASLSPVYIRTRVIGDLNAALQTIQLSGKDFFTREKLTVNLTAGQASYPLSQNTLNVLWPVRLADGSAIREIATRGEYDLFSQIFLGRTAIGAQRAQPMAVFIERLRQYSADNVGCTAYFAPTPDKSYTATLEVSNLPPTYTVADVSEPSPIIPVAHGFTESILLPIVRWNVRTSHYFSRQDLLPAMEAEYLAAMEQLGMADPRIDKPGLNRDVLAEARANAKQAAGQAYRQTLAQAGGGAK